MSEAYGLARAGYVVERPRERHLTPYEVDYVTGARNRPRPVSWSNIAAQLNRCEHDIRFCCDPTYEAGE